MKRALFAATLIATLAGVPAFAASAGRLCLSRIEGPGLPNPQPIRLWGEQAGKRRKLVELKGEGPTCASVPAGQWKLDARSARPSAPKATKGATKVDPNECGSAPLVIDVAKDATVKVFVSPLGGPTIMCGWELN